MAAYLSRAYVVQATGQAGPTIMHAGATSIKGMYSAKPQLPHGAMQAGFHSPGSSHVISLPWVMWAPSRCPAMLLVARRQPAARSMCHWRGPWCCVQRAAARRNTRSGCTRRRRGRPARACRRDGSPPASMHACAHARLHGRAITRMPQVLHAH